MTQRQSQMDLLIRLAEISESCLIHHFSAQQLQIPHPFVQRFKWWRVVPPARSSLHLHGAGAGRPGGEPQGARELGLGASHESIFSPRRREGKSPIHVGTGITIPKKENPPSRLIDQCNPIQLQIRLWGTQLARRKEYEDPGGKNLETLTWQVV